jgi:membrane protein implicated in regulation of membrane protease activity
MFVSLWVIWFSFGALAAVVAGLLGAEFWLQCVVFLAVSAALIAVTRPLAKKYVNARREGTNADRNIGQTGMVTETVDNVLGTGTVHVLGKDWTARSDTGCVIERGEKAEVARIEGVKLFVRPPGSRAGEGKDNQTESEESA